MTQELINALSTIEHLQASPLMANHRAGLDAAHQLLSALAQRPAAQEVSSEAQELAHNMLLWREDARMHGSEYVPVHVHTLDKLIEQLRGLSAPQQATPAQADSACLSDSTESDRQDALTLTGEQQATPEPDTCRKRPRCGRADPCAWDGDARDRLTVNLLRQGAGLTKNQIRALIAHAVDGTEPDPALFHATPEPVGEPALWVLTSQLEARETTTQGYLWFTNPQNSSWTALYTRPVAAPAVPEGFDVQALTATGGGHKYPLIVVREKSSQLGEDVFQDEHPVIYGLLSAWLAAAQAKGGE